MPSEFDDYAAEYSAMLRDPIREKFAPNSKFFCERKWILIREFYRCRRLSTKQTTWLDLGCGNGELLTLGKPYFGKVTGCDPSKEMLLACRGLDVRVQEMPDRIPFSDQSFDLVTAVCVYHHVVTSTGRLLLTSEVVRVLRPGGIFCIVEHNPFNPLTQLIVRRSPVDAHARLLTALTTRRLMGSVGLCVVETRYFLYLAEAMYRKVGFMENPLGRVPLGGQYAVFGQKRH